MERFKKGKHVTRQRKTSNRQDRKFKTTHLENKKNIKIKLKNKWVKREVYAYDRTVRNWLNEMGFTLKMKTSANTQAEKKWC